ncbi:hypothetical protein P7K49_005965 [Saguinus oedipus]|uniref:Uncharacterized protein n=1 Tax=Saguinus oedipus TaxID=9490 RepID=A0ABQ9W132_SAGOE|nr:hypothetical protein P7K49_005965 [Saguinus oedipus]
MEVLPGAVTATLMLSASHTPSVKARPISDPDATTTKSCVGTAAAAVTRNKASCCDACASPSHSCGGLYPHGGPSMGMPRPGVQVPTPASSPPGWLPTPSQFVVPGSGDPAGQVLEVLLHLGTETPHELGTERLKASSVSSVTPGDARSERKRHQPRASDFPMTRPSRNAHG